MKDPTETQPLPWRADEARRRPWAQETVELPEHAADGGDSPLPERLADRGYRLRARVGGGRLGAIYEAQDDLSRSSGSQHFVAIQLVDDRIVSRPGFAADFERGARELQSIAHPNIVKLLEYGRDRNRYYLVWELLESASLRFVLNDVTKLPLEECSAVLRAVGEALLHLHAKSLVHGNLTPANVLVTFGYEVKLLDIVPSGWLDNPADDLGVPARRPDRRDDVFGIGCLAYEMLSGRHPFNGNTAQEAYRAGLEPAPIAQLSGRQWRALAGAIALHRDDRTPSVARFLEEFGVTQVQRLKHVVEAGAEPEIPPPSFEPAPAPRVPTYERTAPQPVFAERAPVYPPERRGMLGKLALFVAVLVAAALAWLYQDPLRDGLTALVAGVESGLASREAPPSEPRSAAAEPEAGSDPLPRTETITDPEPARVRAPGITASEPGIVSAEEPVAAVPAPTPEPPLAAPMEPSPAPVQEPPAAAAPGPTRFSFVQPVVTVRESEVAARVVIRRSGDLSQPATVAWWTAEGTAKPDEDYADLGARVERFDAGEETRAVFVPLIRGSDPKPTRSFNVYLGRGSAGSGEPDSGARIEIVGD